MSKKAFFVACFIGVIVGGATIAVEHNAVARASAENATLRQRLARLNAESVPTPNVVEPQKSGKTEIDRLRVEVDTHAAQARATQKQIDGLAPKSLPPTMPFSMLTIKLPRDSWSFAGYATPEDALQSALWAARDGDAATLRNSLTPQSLAHHGWDSASDAEVTSEAAQALTNATGIEILKYEIQNNGQRTHLTVYLDGVPQSSQPLWIDVDNSVTGWRVNYN